MSLILDGSAGVTFPNSTVQASAGQVLQVVSTSPTGGLASTSSTSFVTTGFSATITPKFATSKILVIFSSYCYVNGANNALKVAMYRGGSAVATTGTNYTSTGAVASAVSLTYLDSPATTSSTTYTLYFKVENAAVIGYVNADNASNTTITLMEIAA